MESLNLADTFVTFLALIGPQKVLLSFGRLARTLDDRSVRAVAAATAVATACVVPPHAMAGGFRAMLLPFVVSPIAIAADLEESISAGGWGGRWTVAGAFALVALVDLVFTWVFTPLLRRMHESVLEVLSRLLGVLLAAVGVGVFLDGLTALGVLHGHGH
jgi:small neutral amino acid transporter SnatA (MarC family)